MTEKEAIAKLNRGINVANWYNWKDRNKDKYSEVLTRIRANKLESLLEQVDKAANGRDGIRHDWRAAQWMLTVHAPERFSDKSRQAEQPVSVAISIAPELARLAFPVVDCPSEPVRDKLPAPEVRALPEARPEDVPQG